jgi:hypothetical protein
VIKVNNSFLKNEFTISGEIVKTQTSLIKKKKNIKNKKKKKKKK